MKFYIATALTNKPAYRKVRGFLEGRGHELTFDWVKAGPVDFESDPDALGKRAVDDLHGVLLADAVIVLLPGGRGTHAEMGAALACGKPILVAAKNQSAFRKPYPCVFHAVADCRVGPTLNCVSTWLSQRFPDGEVEDGVALKPPALAALAIRSAHLLSTRPDERVDGHVDGVEVTFAASICAMLGMRDSAIKLVDFAQAGLDAEKGEASPEA